MAKRFFGLNNDFIIFVDERHAAELVKEYKHLEHTFIHIYFSAVLCEAVKFHMKKTPSVSNWAQALQAFFVKTYILFVYFPLSSRHFKKKKFFLLYVFQTMYEF